MALFSMLRRPSYSALSRPSVLLHRQGPFTVESPPSLHSVVASAEEASFQLSDSLQPPLQDCTIASARTFHCGISTVPTFSGDVSRRSFIPTQRFSTAATARIAHESLIGVLESEIKCALEYEHKFRVDVPDEFPFDIIDTPGEKSILLKRRFYGEVIQVEVDMPNGPISEFGVDDDYNDYGTPLVVSISNVRGRPHLEFGVVRFPDEICIDSLWIKQPEQFSEPNAYEGPDFYDLDDNLQEALHKYLEVRGVNRSTTDFLHQYMRNKYCREYLTWLENLKGFIEH